jgi:hypothetical protein
VHLIFVKNSGLCCLQAYLAEPERICVQIYGCVFTLASIFPLGQNYTAYLMKHGAALIASLPPSGDSKISINDKIEEEVKTQSKDSDTLIPIN